MKPYCVEHLDRLPLFRELSEAAADYERGGPTLAREIDRFLRERGGATVGRLAVELGVTQAAVRRAVPERIDKVWTRRGAWREDVT